MERTPTFTSDVHLAFLRNIITGDMFIAPAIGATQQQAESAMREVYPSAAYALLALYPASDVQRYLVDLARWPGMPSKVQPSLTDLLANQRIRTQTGGLPPLNRAAQQQAFGAGMNAAQAAQVQAIAKGMPAETQALAARLLGNAHPAAPAAQPIQRSAQPVPHPFAPRPVAQPATPQGSLKDALAAMRAMKGIGATVQQSTTPAPKAMPYTQPITRAPIPAQPQTSAHMSPSAMPPSARGMMQDSAPQTPSPFAVGKVSAISVLKALRHH